MASEETAAERWARWHEGQGGEANKSAENKDWDARQHRDKAMAISSTAASKGEHRPAAQAHGVAAEKFDAASKAYAAAGNDHRAARAARDRDEHLKMKEAHEKAAVPPAKSGLGAPPSRPQTEREVNQQARVHAETARNASKVADKTNTPEAHTAAAAAHDVAARHAGSSSAVRMHRSEQARHKEAAAGGALGSWAAKKAGG